MRNSLLAVTTTVTIVLSGCASIDINSVQPDDLKIDVTLRQQNERQQLDVSMRRGIFSQPVTAASGELWVETESGQRIDLTLSNQKGRFGALTRSDALYRLNIADIVDVEIPTLTPVTLSASDALAGQLFFKDDVLELSFADSDADVRWLLFTARCNGNVYQIDMPIDMNKHRQSIRIGTVSQRLNNAAEADLAGIIPVTLTLKEQTLVAWPQPFQSIDISAIDSTDFSIDTSGFRFSANVNVQVNSSFSLNFSNNRWPVQYCL